MTYLWVPDPNKSENSLYIKKYMLLNIFHKITYLVFVKHFVLHLHGHVASIVFLYK